MDKFNYFHNWSKNNQMWLRIVYYPRFVDFFVSVQFYLFLSSIGRFKLVVYIKYVRGNEYIRNYFKRLWWIWFSYLPLHYKLSN